jgi:proline iminopeptidase
MSQKMELFPPLEPYRSGRQAVDAIHTLYWEESGNPAGLPVLFLHGGPGGGTSPLHRRFFDPQAYRIILFDQRGAGKSTPVGEVLGNTTQNLIDDIEVLRRMLGIDRWLVFGGSWGSTLALAYGQAWPERCLGFILRGIFLCTPAEIDWFIHGAQWFHPEAHARFQDFIPPQERTDLIAAYLRRMSSPQQTENLPAARSWSQYEGKRVTLLPNKESGENAAQADLQDLAIARLEAHYMAHLGFFTEDQLILNVDKIRHLPAVIVHGRYDVICPPATAWRLHLAWPESLIHIVDGAGHSAFEPGICAQLVAATEAFKHSQQFS